MGIVSRLVAASSATLVLMAGLQAQGRDDFDLGLGLYERGLFEEAAKSFEHHLETHPKGERSTEAWYRLASCRKKLGRKKSAREAFLHVLGGDARFRHRAETRYQLGRLLQEARQQAKAVIQFEKLLEEAGDRHYLAAPACFALGECRRDLGMKKQALQAFQKAYELAPSGDMALGSLYQSGFLLLDAGKTESAARAFGRAAKEFPKDDLAIECRFLQARALTKLQRHEEALDLWRLVARNAGKRKAEGLLGLGRALIALGRHDEARKPLEEALESHTAKPVNLSIREELAWLLLDAGEAQQAAQRFSEALALEPSREQAARLHSGRGEAWSDLRKYKKALEEQTRAEESSTDPGLQGDALYARIQLLHSMQRYDESLTLTRKFLKEHPGHRSLALANLAQAEDLFALGRYGEASKIYAGIEGQQGPSARHKLAWCLWLLGSKEKAALAFARLVDDKHLAAALREDALAMEALARLELGENEAALARADLYKLRYPKGAFRARCERVASRALEKLGRLEAATKRLRAAVALDEGKSRPQDDLGLADLLQRQGDYEKATKGYAAHAKDPGAIGFRALEGLAWCAFELGDIETCRRYGQEALARSEGREKGAGLRQLLCSVELKAKRWKAAEEMALEFLRTHPEDRRVADMRFSLALAMARGGKSREAERALEDLLEDGAGEHRDQVWYELAWTRRKLGKEEPALAAFRKVAETSKDPALRGEARLHLAESLLASGKKARAQRELAKVEGRYRSRALYRLGLSQFEQKQYREALKGLSKLESLEPADTFTRKAPFLSAECHYELGQHAAAARLFRRYLKEVASRGDHEPHADAAYVARARFHLGHCEHLGKRDDRSAALLRQWISDTGGKASKVDRAQAWLWLGQADQGRARVEAAEKDYKKATTLSEGRIAAEAWYRIGMLRRDQGKLDTAIEAFLRLSILFDEGHWVSKALYEAGLCFESQKKGDKAQKLYRELVDRYPGSEAAKAAQLRIKTKRKL